MCYLGEEICDGVHAIRMRVRGEQMTSPWKWAPERHYAKAIEDVLGVLDIRRDNLKSRLERGRASAEADLEPSRHPARHLTRRLSRHEDASVPPSLVAAANPARPVKPAS